VSSKKGTVWYFWHWQGNKREADRRARQFLADLEQHRTTLTLREYAKPFFSWDECPHTLRRREEGKSIGRLHVKLSRALIEIWVMTDPIADLQLADITRGDILDFRRQLVARAGSRRTISNKAITAQKTALNEAYFRQDEPPRLLRSLVQLSPATMAGASTRL
jgi:tRNA splicing ligase